MLWLSMFVVADLALLDDLIVVLDVVAVDDVTVVDHTRSFGDAVVVNGGCVVVLLVAIGVEGAIVGKALYAGKFTLQEALKVSGK